MDCSDLALGAGWITAAVEQEAKVIKKKLIEVCYVVWNKSTRGNQTAALTGETRSSERSALFY